MSSEPNQATATMEEPTPLKAGVGWVAKHWPRVRLAHEGLMVDKIQRQSRIVEQLARNTMTGDNQDVSGWPGHEGDDSMGVNIGDHIHYHAASEQPAPQQPPATPAPTSAAPAAATPPTEQPKSVWRTWLARTALVAGGLGLGAGGLAGYNAMTADDENPAVAVEQPAEQPAGQQQPYEYPNIIGPGVSTEKWDHLPGEGP